MPTRLAKCSRLPETERVAEVRIQARSTSTTRSARIGPVSRGARCSANPRVRPSAQRAWPGSGGSPPIRTRRDTSSRDLCETAAIDTPRTDTFASACDRSSRRDSTEAIRSRASPGMALHSNRPTAPGKASVASRTATSSSVASASRSGVSGASVLIAALVSRASPVSCPLVTSTPKKRVATSGIWCASSMISASTSGRRSPNPRSLSAMSAKRRWWLTTTTSASVARRRASTTWHPSYIGHFEPRQLSAVEVMARRTGSCSARSVTSARSPLSVRSAHPDKRVTRAANCRETRRPAASTWS